MRSEHFSSLLLLCEKAARRFPHRGDRGAERRRPRTPSKWLLFSPHSPVCFPPSLRPPPPSPERDTLARRERERRRFFSPPLLHSSSTFLQGSFLVSPSLLRKRSSRDYLPTYYYFIGPLLSGVRLSPAGGSLWRRCQPRLKYLSIISRVAADENFGSLFRFQEGDLSGLQQQS